jgi:OmpA-OmpF porin, OOP family
VELGGHSDASGAVAANRALSLKRATAVRDYLVSRGVESSRLQVRAYGSSRPLGAGEAAANRRVEIKVVPSESR